MCFSLLNFILNEHLPTNVRRFIITISLAVTGLLLQAQDIQVSNMEVAANGIITFDFVVQQKYSPEERYTIYIFSSADDYQEPISVNYPDVVPNETNKATINGAQEFRGYSGNLAFKLRAEATFFPVRILNAPGKLVKGQEFTINYESIYDRHNIELVDKNNRIVQLGSNVAGKSYTGQVAKDIKGGKYQLKIIPTNEFDAATVIPSIKVAGKSMWKIAAVGGAGIAAVGVIAITGGSGGGKKTTGGFPDPPPTPDGI